MRDSRGEAGAELLVCGEVTLAGEIDETLAAAADLVRDDERNDTALARQQVGRERLALAQPVDRLASPPTREQHAIRIVEDDDRLTALLDECPPSDRVGVGHVTRF